MSCDPNDLIRSAQCILQCIPPGAQLPSQTAMLDLINGGPTPTNTLIQNAKEFVFRVPPRMQVPLQIYLLLVSLEGTSRTVDDLLRSASCMRCIPRGFIPPVQTNEYCQWSEGGTGGCDNPIVLDWLQRMADNGVTLPSTDTIRAVCDFCDGLDASGLTDKMLVVNPVIPDSLSSMRYPLIWQTANGFSPWLNSNFVAADLDPNGIVGDGSTTYFNTGFNPFTHWGLSIDSLGLSAYESESATGVNDEIDIGCVTPNKNMNMTCWSPASTENFGIGWTNTSAISVNIGDSPGFFALERTTVNRLDLCRNGASIGNNVVAQAGDLIPSATVYAMANNDTSFAVPSSVSTKRISFFSIHEGLTAAEWTDFYSLVQTLRMQLGGGWV